MRLLLSVVFYFALLLGVQADDYTYLQTILDLAHSSVGGVAHIPAGSYSACGLKVDNSADANYVGRVRIEGDGAGSTLITCVGSATPALEIVGSLAAPGQRAGIKGIRLEGDLTTGSIGLKISRVAWYQLDDVLVENFATNLRMDGVEQFRITSSGFRWGFQGVAIYGIPGQSDPNDSVFVNCNISQNDAGILIDHANAITFISGNISHNGSTGAGGTQYGMKFTDPGTGYATILLNGTIFESNGGTGDLIVDASSGYPVQLTLIGTSFQRSPSIYSTNNIRVTGYSAAVTISLIGNVFKGIAGYTPDPTRPVQNIGNAKLFEASSYYSSPVDAPIWYYSMLKMRGIAGANLNFSSGLGGSGASIAATDDAGAILLPLELRGAPGATRVTSSSTPPNGGGNQVTLEAVSNTALRFKMRGTDGVVRQGSITLQ